MKNPSSPISLRLLLPAIAVLALISASCSAEPPRVAGEPTVARLQRKASEFESTMPQWVGAGGNPERIAPMAERLDGLMKSGKFDDAERQLDEMLAVVGAAPSQHTAAGAPIASARATKTRLTPLPASAEIVYFTRGQIYTMDSNGGNVTQITSGKSRHWEHVAISDDRRFLVANYWAQPGQGGQSSRIVLFDFTAGTEVEFLPEFTMAGNGGVDWDPAGRIYFAGVQSEPYPKPRGRSQLLANLGANDIWRARWDGTGVERLTNTPKHGEADVSVSADGAFITYMAVRVDPSNEGTEIWMSRADGSQRKRVFEGGKPGVTSVHDPEFSPDGRQIVFSQVNPDYKNFGKVEGGNTAHDICVVDLDGSNFRSLTEPGPISIIPDWQGSRVVYVELTDQGSRPYRGISVVNQDGSGHRRLRDDTNSPKWIPPAR